MTIILIILAAFVAIIALAFLLEAITRAYDGARFQRPGRLYDAAGARLHAHVTGKRRDARDPVIILDGGLTTNSLAWSKLAPLLAASHQVLVYDRAGHCWSESGRSPRSVEREVEELEALLKTLKLAPPYYYVAHSYSGFLGRVLAKRNPGVAGLVLAETMTEDLVGMVIDKATLSKARLGVLLARLGIMRRMPQAKDSYDAPQAWRAFSMSGKDFSATEAELRTFEAAGVTAAASGRLGDVPLVIVAAVRSTPATRALPAGVSKESANAMLLMTQCNLAKLSTRSRILLSETSDHEIPWQEPEILVRAIATLDTLRSA